MIKKGFFVLLMIMVTIGKGHAQEWNQDNLKTSVTFKIKNFGVTVNGRFHNINVKTNLDTDKLPSSNTIKSAINLIIIIKKSEFFIGRRAN